MKPDLFSSTLSNREPEQIIGDAMVYTPSAIFVGFSGGDDSLATAHWMMNNVPNCQVFHANTGIGIERTREFVRETCQKNGWPLTEIRAKEDCGQDYRQIVLEHGFPGPAMHFRMYIRLKERCVDKLVRDNKNRRRDCVLIAAGIRRDESQIRMGYGNLTVNKKGGKLWVNPLYWWPKEQFMSYIAAHGLMRNPVSQILGMSGECLCGAFAHPGEKSLVRIADPVTADYLDRLETDVRAAGHNWGWEESPPRQSERDTQTADMFEMPFCVGCGKT